MIVHAAALDQDCSARALGARLWPTRRASSAQRRSASEATAHHPTHAHCPHPHTESSDGWTVVASPLRGTNDNSLGAIAASAPNDIWAVGQRNGATYPDAELIEHWDGSRWTAVQTPSHGTASAALYGVSVDRDGGIWAVGETIDANAGGHPLVEHLEDGQWRTVNLPGVGSPWSTLWGVAASEDNVTPLGVFMNLATGNVHTLVLSGSDSPFRVVNAPNPGAGDTLLSGIALVGDTEWAVGHFKDNGPRQTLIMRHQL